MGHAIADTRGLRHPFVRPNHLAAPSRRRAPWDVPPPLGEVINPGDCYVFSPFIHVTVMTHLESGQVCLLLQYRLDDDVFYLFLQKQKIGAKLHIYL